MAFRMAFVVLPLAHGAWKNAAGNTECVELIRQTAGAPHTSRWRAGQKVRDAKQGQIPPYTAIATFVDDKYPTDDKGRHAALYLWHTAAEIRVVDQWKAQGEARERSIRFDNEHGTSRSDEGNAFFVIEQA